VSTELPPQFKRIAELAEQQPPEVQEVFQLMLAVAMEESGAAGCNGDRQGTNQRGCADDPQLEG
jgi:hypothetical protein